MELVKKPQDYILCSFNALDPKIANDPSKILERTSNYLISPLTDDQTLISEDDQFYSTYHECKSSHESHTKSAESIGISGKYGVYSGSCQVNHSDEQSSSSTYFHSVFHAKIHKGSCSFYQSTNIKAIRELLSDVMIKDLDNIDDYTKAEAFTKAYGTHLITGVKLGGSLSFIVKIETSSYSDKEAVAATVSAAYSAINSISATASASHSVSQTKTSGQVTQKRVVLGGDASKSVLIDPEKEETIENWAESCNINSVCGLFDAIEISELASNNDSKEKLKDYLNFALLKHSIENPIIFSNHVTISANTYNTADTVTASADTGYKIISGGAQVPFMSNNFLVDCCPQLDSNNIITGWIACSHACMIPSDANQYLTAYAIAIYDPQDLLDINCVQSNELVSPSPYVYKTSAQLKSQYRLIGGGGKTTSDNQFTPYLTSSYPSGNSWEFWTTDYVEISENVSITGYAIGINIKFDDIIINIPTLTKVTGPNENCGNNFAALGNNKKVAGGGAQIMLQSQNLLQTSFPNCENGTWGWQENNKDLNGVYSPCVAISYVFSLSVSTILSITLEPWYSDN